jgi:hypothetical protein
LVLSLTGSIKLGFIIEGRLAAVLITPSLGVPNWSVIYINTAPSPHYKDFHFQSKPWRGLSKVAKASTLPLHTNLIL